jgi:hypothetical protein
MKIDFEGRTWAYSDEEITVADAEVIEQQTGGTLLEWARSRSEPGAANLKLLYWLMRSQNGDPLPLAEVNCRILPFWNAFVAALNAEAEAAAEAAGEADPTGQPGTPPAASRETVPPGPGAPDPASLPG